MELTIPATMPITIGAILAFLTMFGSVIGVYYRLNSQMSTIMRKFEVMEQRNIRADHETETVKAEQAAQKTTVAVMAEQIGGISRTIERIDRNVEDLVKTKK